MFTKRTLKKVNQINFSRILMILISTLMIPLFAHANDVLAGTNLKTNVEDTFGWGSTFMNVLLICEVVLAVITFIKAKNPLIFVGVLLLCIIVPVAISVISGL